MYNEEEQTDLRLLLRTILTNFLMSMATGTSIDDFLTNNDQVHQLLGLFEELQTENLSLESTINRATEIIDAQEQSLKQGAALPLQEITLLLSRAMDLLGGSHNATPNGGTFDNASYIEYSIGEAELEVNTEPTVGEVDEVNTEPTVGEVELEVNIPEEEHHEISHESGDSDGDTLAGVDAPVEEILQEDFDLEDEDLDNAPQPLAHEATEEIVKNPEITEEFTSLDNSHMVTFISVRYSHLPYHYTVGNVRYKLVISGSQIVSTRV